jgi:hypothetical protein
VLGTLNLQVLGVESHACIACVQCTGTNAWPMYAGGTEACVDAVSLTGFSRMRALSTAHSATPSSASRPFDSTRDGFVLAEGAGARAPMNHTLTRLHACVVCVHLRLWPHAPRLIIQWGRMRGCLLLLQLAVTAAAPTCSPFRIPGMTMHMYQNPQARYRVLNILNIARIAAGLLQLVHIAFQCNLFDPHTG